MVVGGGVGVVRGRGVVLPLPLSLPLLSVAEVVASGEKAGSDATAVSSGVSTLLTIEAARWSSSRRVGWARPVAGRCQWCVERGMGDWRTFLLDVLGGGCVAAGMAVSPQGPAWVGRWGVAGSSL